MQLRAISLACQELVSNAGLNKSEFVPGCLAKYYKKIMFEEVFLSYLIVIPRWKKDWIDFDYFVIIRGQSMTDTV